MTLTYEEIYKQAAEKQIKKSYKDSERFYKANSMDFSDIEQEMKLLVWQLYEKKKTVLKEKELLNYIFITVKNQLNDYIMNSVKLNISDDVYIFATPENEHLKPRALLNKLKQDKKITDVEYRILSKRFIEGKSLATIANEEGLKKRRIDYIYTMLVKRLANKEDKDHYIAGVNVLTLAKNSNEVDSDTDESDIASVFDLLSTEDSKDFRESSELFFEMIKPILNELEYSIIYNAYYNGQSFEEVGKLLNVTKQRVEQIHAKAIIKLKNKLKKELDF